jgi:hypothetical protein
VAKIITTVTTVYDTVTKEVIEYRDVTEKVGEVDFLGVAPSLLKLQSGIRYTDSVCAKCELKIAVRVSDYSPGMNFCQACAMAKVGA